MHVTSTPTPIYTSVVSLNGCIYFFGCTHSSSSAITATNNPAYATPTRDNDLTPLTMIRIYDVINRRWLPDRPLIYHSPYKGNFMMASATEMMITTWHSPIDGIGRIYMWYETQVKDTTFRLWRRMISSGPYGAGQVYEPVSNTYQIIAPLPQDPSIYYTVVSLVRSLFLCFCFSGPYVMLCVVLRGIQHSH
jgi:hypothetical protein